MASFPFFFFHPFFSSHLKFKQVMHFWVPYSTPHQPLLLISLSFMAWHAGGTGSTHPGEKWQLFTASCSAHKQQGEASTQVSTCLFQNVSVASMVGKSSGNVSNTLHNFLESSLQPKQITGDSLAILMPTTDPITDGCTVLSEWTWEAGRGKEEQS